MKKRLTDLGDFRSGTAALICLLVTAVSAGAQSPEPGVDDPSREIEAATADSRVIASYRIGPGDVIAMEVFDVPVLSRSVRVQEDGTFYVPLVGHIPLAGRTLREAQAEITNRLSDGGLVVDPQVSLFVEEFSSLGVSVLGAVGRPGVHQLVGGRTLLHALGLANGVTDRAGGRILISRVGPDGEGKTYQIEARRLLVVGDPALNVTLRPGDTVMVPAREIARVFVSGSVSRPGAIEFDVEDGIDLLQAVIAAGGVPGRKEGRSAVVLRTKSGDPPASTRVDMDPLWSGDVAAPALEPSDVVIVGER